MDESWQRCISDFLQSIEDISGSIRSRMAYHYVLNRFFADSRNPDEYSRSDVQAFLNEPSRLRYKQGQQVKPATKNQRLMVLNSFYKYAATYEIHGQQLLEKPAPSLGLKYLKTGPAYKALTADELERFFSAIDNSTITGLRDRALFLTFFWTGRRRSEIARLTWSDIEQAVIVESDGTRRAGVIYRYIAKGKSREVQTSELPAPAWNATLAYLQRAGRLPEMQPEYPVFSSLRPDQPHHALTGGRCNHIFKFYCKRAGLSPSYSLHSLRHCAARLRYEAGSSIQDVQIFLGHSSLATTDVYLKRLTGISDPGAKLLIDRFGTL